MIYSYLIILSLLSLSRTNALRVYNFQLIDLANSSVADRFPVLYLCNFTVNNLNFSILFRRQTTRNVYVNKFDLNKYYTYESVSVRVNSTAMLQFSSQSILYLSVNSFLNAAYSILEYETIMTIFKTRTSSFMRSQQTIEPYLKIETNKNPVKKRNTDYQSKYIAVKFPNPLMDKAYVKRTRKDLHKEAKYHLVIETCVQIHFNVYKKFQKLLATTNHEYTRLFLSIYFAHMLTTVNTIFKQIDTGLFTLQIEFVKLIINTAENLSLNMNSTHTNNALYLRKLNDQYWEHHKTRRLECDHMIFYHDYKEAAIVGMAAAKGVCKSDALISLILFQLHASTEIVIAHEILHNMGAYYHDDDFKNVSCMRGLMNSYLIDGPKSYVISECAINQIKNALFNNFGLIPVYECMLKENNLEKQEVKIYNLIAAHESSGYFYSVSDQCKLFTLDPTSFAVEYHEKCGTYDLKCFYNNGALKYSRVLDGTKCGSDRMCQSSQCVEDNSKFDTSKPYLKSALQVRDLCPQGTSQMKNINSEYQFDCSELVENPRKDFNCKSEFKYEFQSIMYSFICCESCAKANLSKCRRKTSDCKTTCESFESNPCYNNGKCITSKKALELNRSEVFFYCECPTGFRGDLCLTFSPCDFKPCRPSELCLEYGDLGQYYCLCSNDANNYLSCNLSSQIDIYTKFNNNLEFSIIIKEKIRFYSNNILLIVFFIFIFVSVFKINLNNQFK